MKNVKGLCFGCGRFNPAAKGNCILAKDWMFLSTKHGYKLMVVDCPQFAAVAEVFPEVNAQPVKKTGNKKIDLEEEEVGEE